MVSFRTGAQKLGQPVPESYFVSEANRSRPQTTQMYTPGSWLFQYSPVKGRSVPLLMQTSYYNGESCCRSFALSNFSTMMDVPARLKVSSGGGAQLDSLNLQAGYICGAFGFCCHRASRVPEGSSKMANHPWPGTSFFGATILPPAFLIFSRCSSTEFTRM